MKKVYVAILVFVFALGGLAAGTFYGRQMLVSLGLQQLAMGQMGGPGRGQNVNSNGSLPPTSGTMGGALSGSVVEITDEYITLQKEDGGSEMVYYSDLTSVSQVNDYLIVDLQTGDKITVIGKENSDGSYTAENVVVGEGFSWK
ncbi:MAG: hypothetical protein WC570_00390 [Patescibacteria group bacterium]